MSNQPINYQNIYEDSPRITQDFNFTSNTEKDKIIQTPPSQRNCLQRNVIQYLKNYFRVTQSQLVQRIGASLNPMSTKLSEIINQSPDIYGPFWILTSLAFIVFLSGNISYYLADDSKKLGFRLELIRVSLMMLYTFGGTLPLVFWGLSKIKQTQITVVQVTCIYGYSFIMWIPASIFCIFSNYYIQFLIFIIVTASSSTFLFKNITAINKINDNIVNAIIVTFQLSLLLVFRFMFFL